MGEPDELREARRALGRQLALLRRAAGYSQHEFAPLTHYGRSTIANVEVGRQNVSQSFWQTCDEVLHAGGVLAAGYTNLRRIEARTRVTAAHALGVPSLPVADVASRDRDTRPDTGEPHHPRPRNRTRTPQVGERDDDGRPEARDDGAAVLVDALTRTHLPVLDQGGGADPQDLWSGVSVDEAADLILQRFLKLDDEQGGGDLYEPMSRIVAGIAPEVEETGVGLGALGRLTQMSGWLALDSSRHGAARRHLGTTVYAAHEADDPALAASALAYLSLQDTYRGRPGPALSLAKTALEVSDGSVSRLTKTMLATRLARAHAALGDTRSSLHALDVARATYEAPIRDVEPVWVSYVDEIELSAQAGACYLDLRRPGPARRALRQALDVLETRAPHRVRDQVHYLSRLAKCDLLSYDVDAACHTAGQALRLAGTLGSARVVDRLREFHGALQPFAKNRAVRDFRDAFTEQAGPHRR